MWGNILWKKKQTHNILQVFSIRFPKSSHDFGTNPLIQIIIMWTKCSHLKAFSPSTSVQGKVHSHTSGQLAPVMTTRSWVCRALTKLPKALNPKIKYRGHKRGWGADTMDVGDSVIRPPLKVKLCIFVPRSHPSTLHQHSSTLFASTLFTWPSLLL